MPRKDAARSMPKTLRDLGRQRLRTALTIWGVGLGIFTLVVLGALGEHFRAVVTEAKGYTAGVVRLFTKTDASGVNPGITPEAVARVRSLSTVRRVAPTLMLYFDGFDLQEDPLAFLQPKPLVEGVLCEDARLLRRNVELLAGRWLREGDERHAMVVDWIADRRGYEVGGEVTIRHRAYEVVGIYRAPDAPMIPAGIVPYAVLNRRMIRPQVEEARRFLSELLAENPGLASGLAPEPEALESFAREFAREQARLYRVYEVVPRDRSPEGTRALARRLREELPDLAVIDPERVAENMERAMGIFLVITGIVTVLSTVVGGLLIVNTMAMAVIERRPEIAIKSALGATAGQIAREFVAEAALLGLAGAALGSALGVLAVWAAEPWLLAQIETGARLFLVTPRLLALAAAYGVGMGALAGGVPAVRAARVDPAVVLRGL